MAGINTLSMELLAAENKALKAQVNYLLSQLGMAEYEQDDYDLIINKTPEQCLNSIKAEAIEDMCVWMPSSGFTKTRNQSIWIGDYIDNLMRDNG